MAKKNQKMESTKMEKKEDVKMEKVNLFEKYRQNEEKEYLMTEQMVKDFLAEHSDLKQKVKKSDPSMRRIVRMNEGKEEMVGIVRLDESAKMKQIHHRTGATKKVVSKRNEETNIRYKIIFVQKSGKYELWSCDGAGKRKMEKRGTLEEVQKVFDSMFEKKEEKKVSKKVKKSA